MITFFYHDYLLYYHDYTIFPCTSNFKYVIITKQRARPYKTNHYYKAKYSKYEKESKIQQKQQKSTRTVRELLLTNTISIITVVKAFFALVFSLRLGQVIKL